MSIGGLLTTVLTLTAIWHIGRIEICFPPAALNGTRIAKRDHLGRSNNCGVFYWGWRDTAINVSP